MELYAMESERDALMSPCYDHGPVIHDRNCDDKKPVVIQVPSRVDDEYFFWP